MLSILHNIMKHVTFSPTRGLYSYRATRFHRELICSIFCHLGYDTEEGLLPTSIAAARPNGFEVYMVKLHLATTKKTTASGNGAMEKKASAKRKTSARAAVA